MTAKELWLIQSVEDNLLPKQKTVEDHTPNFIIRNPNKEGMNTFSRVCKSIFLREPSLCSSI